MGYIVTNHDFTHGELDKSLFARSDLTFYNKGARICKNLVVMPGGGVRSRFGTKQDMNVGELPFDGQSANQMFSWVTGYYNYLIIITSAFTNGLIVYELDGPTIYTFDNPYNTFVEQRNVDGAQNQDEYVICCPDEAPYVFTSDETTGAVTFELYDFKNPPTYDYFNNYDDWTFSLSTTTVTVGTTWSTLTCTAGTEWGGLTDDYVGGVFEALGPTTQTSIGRARIISVDVVAQTAEVQIISEFDSSLTGSGVPGTQAYIAPTAYNDNRGWPKAVSFFEDRLIFGGGGGVPQTIFFSAIGDFRDFDPAKGLDSDAIAYTIASGAQDAIQNIISGRSLQVFTSSSEMATPVWGTTALTPGTVAIRSQTTNGSYGVKPTVLDNQTLYAKKGGRAVMAFTVASDEESYDSIDASVMSSHLIQTPVELASYTVNDAYDSNLLIGINEQGKMFLYETLAEQSVSAWVDTSSQGLEDSGPWKNVCVVDDRVFFIADRSAVDGFVLEELDWSVCLDCYQTYTATTTGTVDIAVTGGISPLAATSVSIVTDISPENTQEPTGTYIGDYESDSGTITGVPVVDGKTYYIGYKFEQKLQTMASQVQAQTGDTLYVKKRLYKVYVDYINSYPFKVNDIPVPMDHLYSDGSGSGIILDEPLPPSDGIWAMPTNNMGWDRRVYVTCVQDEPLPISIIGIGVELAV